MNRRNFFGNIAKAVACFTILPSATTYARKWVALESCVIAPGYCDIVDLERFTRLLLVVPIDNIWTPNNFVHA